MYRYRRWDGSQDPFGDLLPSDELVDRFSRDLLDGWGADHALERLMRRGLDGHFDGLDALRERIRRLREQMTERGELRPLDDVVERLSEVTDLERLALADDPSDDARMKELELDTMPDSPAKQIAALRDYEFASPEAEAAFEALVEELRAQMAEQMLSGIGEAMAAMTEEDMAALKDMVADLNVLLAEHNAGTGPSQAAFDEFMAKHGRFFPEQPQSFDELLEVMAQRAAAMSRFMASLSPEQRAELQALSDELLSDLDLRFQMSQLADGLREAAPGLGWGRPMPGGDGPPVGLAEGLAEMERASVLDRLEDALAQGYPGASLEDIDRESLVAALGDEAGRDLDALRQIEAELERAGVIARSEGRVELTPRGVRKLGERALVTVFERLDADRPGGHDTAHTGGRGEPTGQTRQWRHGDDLRLDLGRTIANAVRRTGPSDAGVRLSVDDFELGEMERRTRVSTVLLLDMSRSMPLRGHWVHAKRMALALHALISGTYPEDSLDIVGFSDLARRMSPADLAVLDWEPVYGTNMEHAFNLAGRILADHPDASRQVLLVTDGEPTAHLMEGGMPFFQWPPAWETIEKTMKEAMRLARSGVTLNVFMLEESPGLVRFMDHLAKTVGGRVFSTPSDRVGEMVVSDYVRTRG